MRISESRTARRSPLGLGRLGRLSVLLLLAAAKASAQGAPGDLLVAPTRVVLEGSRRTAEVTLVNMGSATATYRIAFVNLRMNEQGGTKEISPSDAAADERSAEPLIRYSPRQVTLQPKIAQTVRIQLRLPPELPPGEYRSHLQFRAVPDAPVPPAAGEAATDFSIQLVAVFGVSIPVIVRHGETSATATLSDLELRPSSGPGALPSLRFRIDRAGNRSVYGDLAVTFEGAGSPPTVLGLANGVAVYTPNTTRTASLDLRVPPGVRLEHGRLHLAFTEQGKAGKVIADADLVLP
jgi:P pilus assembly chaperone PapD